jgi:pyruvate/2-oxoglutarate dehydrogenase complex dihydrolipoamide acyltransferase (E2) component
VETDKAVMEVEAVADGFLTGVSYGEGEDVPVGKVIARISDSAEDGRARGRSLRHEDGRPRRGRRPALPGAFRHHAAAWHGAGYRVCW